MSRVSAANPGAGRTAASSAADLRRVPRFGVEGVRCGLLGWALDISATGVRVRSLVPMREGSTRTLRLRARESRRAVRLRARCVWRRREGVWWVHGLAFDDPNRFHLKAFVELAERHVTPGAG